MAETTIVDAVQTHARTRPAALACADLETNRRWTYAQLNEAVDRTAGWLAERLGPASGERVATLARNSAEMLILQLGCVRAGAVFVPLNWRLAEAELAALILDCAPSLLFHDRGFTETAAAIAPECALIDMEPSADALAAHVADGPPHAPHYARRDWEAPTTLLYTSGTSGRPKGVIVNERCAFWGNTNFIHGNGVSFDSVFLCDMPMFHTAGLFAATRTPILAGAAVLISQGFDPIKTAARLSDPALGITHYFAVPQMAQMMWQAPGFDPARLTGLKALVTGGAPNPAAQIERFAAAGICMANGFGMSETSSNLNMPIGDFDILVKKAGSCGLPLLTVQTRIVDEDGQDVADGETGELWLAGPSVTPGYWNRPEENAKAFVDGWFRTGDAAVRDEDGFFWLVDRKKDMYISGGENVYPAEVEAALAELHDVGEAAVVGVPDAKWGEVGRVYVIPRAGAAIDAETVLAHCRGRLAKFKVPATAVITDAIPRTASGKVQKHILKARALEEMAEG